MASHIVGYPRNGPKRELKFAQESFRDGKSSAEGLQKEVVMRGKNYGICHSCRQTNHWFADCPRKKCYPRCGEGFLRLFEREKMMENHGKLFYSCVRTTCHYFSWYKEENQTAEEATNDLSRLLKTCAQISKNEDVEIDVIRIRKNKRSSNGKGKKKLRG